MGVTPTLQKKGFDGVGLRQNQSTRRVFIGVGRRFCVLSKSFYGPAERHSESGDKTCVGGVTKMPLLNLCLTLTAR